MKTFAQVLQPSQSTTSIEQISKPRKWTTPEANKKHETIISIQDKTNSKDVIGLLKETVQPSDVDGGFKNIKALRNGSVLIESYSKNQQNKLEQILKSKTDINVKGNQNTNPMFLIGGIEKGYNKEDFLNELIRLNSDIEIELGQNVRDKITVITKRTCRNQNKENWILQATPEIAKWFLKRERVIFDLVNVYVEEHYNLAVCFKCSRFGHISKFCHDKECCHKCGKEHKAKDCQETDLSCPNCERMKYENKNHSSRSFECPVYQRKLENYKSTINYRDDFL